MVINKVVYNGNTLLDLTGDTVTPGTLAEGVTAHDKSGAAIVGTMTGGGGDPVLPAGHVRCGYIRFNSEQSVDTGIIPTQDTKVRIVYTRDSDEAMYLYGVVNSGNTASVTAYLSAGGGTWRFGNKGLATNISVDENLVQTAIVSKTGIVRAHLTQSLSGVSDFEAIGSLIIGACRNANGTVGSAQFIGKILVFEMWDGDTEVLHLSPVVSTDGMYRFYDEVSKTFFDSITDTPLEGGNI